MLSIGDSCAIAALDSSKVLTFYVDDLGFHVKLFSLEGWIPTWKVGRPSWARLFDDGASIIYFLLPDPFGNSVHRTNWAYHLPCARNHYGCTNPILISLTRLDLNHHALAESTSVLRPLIAKKAFSGDGQQLRKSGGLSYTRLSEL